MQFENDLDIKKLTFVSHYDLKHVFSLTAVLKYIKWNTLKWQVFNPTVQFITFLKPNFSNDYNQDMDHVDIIDHLEENFQLGKSLLQCNWWLLTFLGIMERYITNAYKFYMKWHEEHKMKFLLLYDFCEAAVLAWLDHDWFWFER